ncbi:MAG: 2'-5' RNA ligase family protein [Ideonella sp.]|nr:2'-5' RNA ligase family protein [Ideonella sp.]
MFIAVWPTPTALDGLRRWSAAWTWPPGSTRVPASRLHLTLHYIGDLPWARLPEVADGLAVPFRRFELTLGRAQRWPGGLAVAVPHGSPAGLTDLHAALAAALARLGLPVAPRPFRPHVTLARGATAAVPPACDAAIRWVVGGYSLVSSDRGYHPVRRYRCTPTPRG